MGEIERALVAGFDRRIFQHHQIGLEHQQFFQRDEAAIAGRRAGRRCEAGFSEQGRRQDSRDPAYSRRARPPKRCEIPGCFCAASRARAASSSATSLSPRSAWPSKFATSRICLRALAMSATRSTSTTSNPCEASMRLRDGAVVRSDQHQVGLERDGRLRLPVQPAKSARLVGDDRQVRIGGIGREPGDLVRIGQRDHQLVGAQIERDNAMRRMSDGRASGHGQRSDGSGERKVGFLRLMRA